MSWCGLLTAAQCQLFVVDVRRSLIGVVQAESEHHGGYLASADAVGEVVPRLIEELRRRMPLLNATPLQLRERSWWSGPEIYVVIDDYDLVGSAGGNPLASLSELLPHSKDWVCTWWWHAVAAVQPALCSSHYSAGCAMPVP